MRGARPRAEAAGREAGRDLIEHEATGVRRPPGDPAWPDGGRDPARPRLGCPASGGTCRPGGDGPAPDARLDAPPRAVVIRFTERVEPRASCARRAGRERRPREPGRWCRRPGDPWRYRVALEPLPPGAYTVSWRVLSADTATSPVAPRFHGRDRRPAGQSGPTVRSGGGWRPSPGGWSGWAARCSWAPSLAVRCSVLSQLDGSACWRVREVSRWRLAGRSTSCSRRARLRARARRCPC